MDAFHKGIQYALGKLGKSKVGFARTTVSNLMAFHTIVSVYFHKTMYNKTILNSAFVISGIIKVSVSLISLGLQPRLITLASTLIIPDITKTHPIIVYYYRLYSLSAF